MQIYLDKKAFDCLRRNNTVSFHMNGSFYTLSYSKRKDLDYLEEIKLKERKKEI